MFEIELTHSVEGTVRDSPNIKDLVVNLERNQDFKGMFLSYSGDFQLVGDLKTFVDNVFATHGLDSIITGTIYQAGANDPAWRSKYTFIIDGEQYSKREERSVMGFEDSEFERNIIQKQNVEVEYNILTSLNGTTLPGFTNRFQDVLYRAITETTRKGILPYELFTDIIQKITNSAYPTITSSFFGRSDSDFDTDFGFTYPSDGKGAYVVATKGAYISGSTPNPETGHEEGKTSVTFKFGELFREYSRIFNLGAGISTDASDRKILEIEELDYFFPTSTMITVDTCNNLEIGYDSSLFIKDIDASYSKTDDENDYGLSEYNGKSMWTTEVNIGASLDLVNQYITSFASLEKALANPVSGRSDDKEFSTDKLIFLQDCFLDGATIKTVKDDTFSLITGIYPDNTYQNNVFLSPARKVNRHGNIIKIGLDNNGYSDVKFSLTEGLSELSSQHDTENVTINETADMSKDDMTDPFLSGRTFKLNCTLTDTQIETLKTQRNGLVKFTNYLEGNADGYGFIDIATINVVTGEVEFTLREAANLDTISNNRITESTEEDRLTEDGELRIIE